jgi:Holliday junction resolvase RusA-like endonuclease
MFIFTLHMDPVPQKQTRFTCIGGYPRTYDPSKKDLEQIQWQIKPYAPIEPLKGPVEVRYSFFMRIPKSTSGIQKRQMLNRKIHHIKRPDLDNLEYIVTNAMKGIVYHDDSQIVRKFSEKFYGDPPKVVIQVIDVCDSIGLDSNNTPTDFLF